MSGTKSVLSNPKSQSTETEKDKKNRAAPKHRVIPTNLNLYKANLDLLVQIRGATDVLAKFEPRTVAVVDNLRFPELDDPKYLVIIGFSSMKVLETVMRTGKEIDYVLIIEPDMSVFHGTIMREYIGTVLNNPRIDCIFGVPPAQLGPCLHKIFSKIDEYGARQWRCLSPEVIFDPFVYGIDHPVFKQVRQVVSDTARNLFEQMGCSLDNHLRWEQFYKNRKNIQDAWKVAPLIRQFSACPVIVVGAGPSCKEFIEQCKTRDLTDKALVIACDAVMPLMLREGIKPHIVLRCERALTRIFKGVTREDTKGIYFAAYPWVDYAFFDLFDDHIMLFRDNGLCRWSGYTPGEVNGGVSSANAALELALLLGAKQIILTGVDCCFIDNRTHVPGTEVEVDVEESKATRTQVPGNAGEPVTTTPVWFRCLLEYQNTISKHTSGIDNPPRVINTSLKGAKIEGAQLVPWPEVVLTDEVHAGGKIQQHLERHIRADEAAFREKVKQTLEYLREAKYAMETLFLESDDALLLAMREQHKCMQQLKSHVVASEFFNNVEGLDAGLTKMFAEAVKLIDAFKLKWISDPRFQFTLIDICRNEHSRTENQVGALRNRVRFEHERMRQYCLLHLANIRILHTYCDKLIRMLEEPDKYFEEKRREVLA
ncbi:MAG: motility associated factor glycosyltransferase family protein [Sulfitobacter sp.]|nr:motility associated factor glycosyltransferase family protein [Sulfitobacter sp.]